MLQLLKKAGILGRRRGFVTEDLSKLSHPSERDAARKKRRSDATGFDDLMNLLVEID
jgi:hypothetical protein